MTVGVWSWLMVVAGVLGVATGRAQPALPAGSDAMPGKPFAVVAHGDALFVSLSGRGVAKVQSPSCAGKAGPMPSITWSLSAACPLALPSARMARMLAVADGRRTVLLDATRVLSGEGDPLLARFGDQSGALGVAFSPDGGSLAITEERANRVPVVSPGHPDAAPVHIAVGALPVGVVASPDGHWLYVTSEAASAAGGGPCPADTGPGSVVHASGVFPRGVAALPDGFAVALFGSRALQFVPPACPIP